MTKLDVEVQRLAKRITVARLGLAQGGPVELLQALLAPVVDSIDAVTEQLMATEQPTFEPVDESIGPATTSALADMVSPVPPARHRLPPPPPKLIACLNCDRRLEFVRSTWVTALGHERCEARDDGRHVPC